MKVSTMSLRRRVTLAYTSLGLILSFSFAVAAVFITEDYEHILVDEILRGQADDYALRLAANPATVLPQSHRLSGYLRRPNGQGSVPLELVNLAPGIHETESYGVEGIHIGVFDTDQGRLYFVIDLSDIERLERHLELFLIGVIVVGTALAGWLGWLLATRTIAPVRRLAEAVDALSTRPQASALADTVGDDELGRLATSIDRYQTRLLDADTLERRFFADASHELRTPIAVVRGAAELLLDESALPERTRRVLQRMDRGVRELTDLLDVLLQLGRRRELEFEVVDTKEFLVEVVDSLQDAAGSSLDVRIEAKGEWRVARRESLLVLRGVLRHLLISDDNGMLTMRVEGDVLEMSFSTSNSAAVAPIGLAAQRSDGGLAVTLVGRMAEALGWKIDVMAPTDTARRARIRLKSG